MQGKVGRRLALWQNQLNESTIYICKISILIVAIVAYFHVPGLQEFFNSRNYLFAIS